MMPSDHGDDHRDIEVMRAILLLGGVLGGGRLGHEALPRDAFPAALPDGVQAWLVIAAVAPRAWAVAASVAFVPAASTRLANSRWLASSCSVKSKTLSTICSALGPGDYSEAPPAIIFWTFSFQVCIAVVWRGGGAPPSCAVLADTDMTSSRRPTTPAASPAGRQTVTSMLAVGQITMLVFITYTEAVTRGIGE